MFLTKIVLANTFISAANLIFILSLLPQIILNYKIRSTKGLSDLFILASLNGQFSYLIYAFSKDLPVIYKIINPIYALLFLVVIFQRFYYSDKTKKDKKILRLYSINVLVLVYLFYLIYFQGASLVNIIGWVPVGIGLCKKVPQMFKVYRAKSVHGFSMFFILLSLFSYFLETIAGLILNLPAPVLMNGLRGFLVNLVFLFQFKLYKSY